MRCTRSCSHMIHRFSPTQKQKDSLHMCRLCRRPFLLRLSTHRKHDSHSSLKRKGRSFKSYCCWLKLLKTRINSKPNTIPVLFYAWLYKSCKLQAYFGNCLQHFCKLLPPVRIRNLKCIRLILLAKLIQNDLLSSVYFGLDALCLPLNITLPLCQLYFGMKSDNNMLF